MIPAVDTACFLSTSGATQSVVDEAIDHLGGQLHDGADLGFVFATRHHVAGLRPLSERLRDRLGCHAVIGATMCGVMGEGQVVSEGPGLSVGVVRLPDAGLHLFDIEQKHGGGGGSSGDDETGRLAEDSAKPALIVVLADVHTAPAGAMVRRLNEQMPDVPIVGGRVACGRKPGSTRLLLNDAVLTRGAIGVSISGKVSASAVRVGGVEAISPPLVVTKGQRSVIRQVGGLSVVSWMRDWLQGLNPGQRNRVLEGELWIGRLAEERVGGGAEDGFVVAQVDRICRATGSVFVRDAGLRAGQTVRFFLPAPERYACGFSDALSRWGQPSGLRMAFGDWRMNSQVGPPNDAGGKNDVAAAAAGAGCVGGLVHGEIGPIAGVQRLNALGVSAAQLSGV